MESVAGTGAKEKRREAWRGGCKSESSVENMKLLRGEERPEGGPAPERRGSAHSVTLDGVASVSSSPLPSAGGDERGDKSPKKLPKKKVLSLAKFMKKTRAKRGVPKTGDDVPSPPISPHSVVRKKRLSTPINHAQQLDRAALAMPLQEEAAGKAEEPQVVLRPESSWAGKLAKKRRNKRQSANAVSVLLRKDLESQCRLSFAVVDRSSFDELVELEKQLSGRDAAPRSRKELEELLQGRKSVRLQGDDLIQAFAERYTVVDSARKERPSPPGRSLVRQKSRLAGPASKLERQNTSSSPLRPTEAGEARRKALEGAAADGPVDTETSKDAGDAGVTADASDAGEVGDAGDAGDAGDTGDAPIQDAELEEEEEEEEEQLEPMSEEELRRQAQLKAVVKELVDTEQHYIDKLQLVVDIFLAPIRERKLLTPYEIATLFGNIEELLPLHVAIMDDLESAILVVEQSEGVEPLYAQWVGEIFAEHAPLLAKAYISFCSNQPAINSRLKEYKQSHIEFQAFLNECLKKEECKKQDLASFLIQPMQRLCKYPLFFGQLGKYTPEDDDQRRFLKEGRMQVLSLVDEVNTKVNHISNLTALVEVNMRLENAEMWQPTVVKDHELLYETVEEINEQPMFLFVFTDMLLICKQVLNAPPSPNPRRATVSNPESPPKRKVKKPKLRVDKLISSRGCQIQTGGDEGENVVSLLVDGCDIVDIRCTNRQRKRLLEKKLKLCFDVASPPAPRAETSEVDFIAPEVKMRKRSHSNLRKSSRLQHGSSPAVIASPRFSPIGEGQRVSSDSGPRRMRKRNRVNSMPAAKFTAITKIVSKIPDEDEETLVTMGAEKLAELLIASRRLLGEERCMREEAEGRLHDLQALYDLVKQDSQRYKKADPPLDLAVENRRLRAQLGAAQSRLIALEEGS